MQSFFDTSAIVPLLIQEPHSGAALEIWQKTKISWAWAWLKVEAEAALVRRQASSASWRDWRTMEEQIRWLDQPTDFPAQVSQFNRVLGLRAADAGHLLIFEKAVGVIPELTLATFDREMEEAAKKLCLPVH